MFACFASFTTFFSNFLFTFIWALPVLGAVGAPNLNACHVHVQMGTLQKYGTCVMKIEVQISICFCYRECQGLLYCQNSDLTYMLNSAWKSAPEFILLGLRTPQVLSKVPSLKFIVRRHSRNFYLKQATKIQKKYSFNHNPARILSLDFSFLFQNLVSS